jgi:hypothetical protein
MSKPCKCEFCKESKMMSTIIAQLPKKEAEWLIAFYNGHLNVAMDAEYYKAIIDGNWPSAERILMSSLNKIRREKCKSLT